jgi:uroporphyrinogen-III decarboxylase
VTETQWRVLLRVLHGEEEYPLPAGFIIDCPWLPQWYGCRMIDYFTNDQYWFDANLKAMRDFPEAFFLPGFWSEYGMCTEPSAFGARCTFPPDEFPHAHALLRSTDDIDAMPVPNPKTDGMLPFVLNRLRLAQPKIQGSGHAIRFAVARGPLNIASYLMGTTEFLTAMIAEPEKIAVLLRKITAFLKDWLDLQRETFPSIDGIFLLDDIIGFIGETQFREFGLPYFQQLFTTDVAVRFLHNDAQCKVSAPFLPQMNVNLFNMGFDITLNQLRERTGDTVTLLGNIPPRDVLAAGSPDEVRRATSEMLRSLHSTRRIIPSCGGGMPPGVRTENVRAFLDAVRGFPQPEGPGA